MFEVWLELTVLGENEAVHVGAVVFILTVFEQANGPAGPVPSFTVTDPDFVDGMALEYCTTTGLPVLPFNSSVPVQLYVYEGP